MLFESSSLLSSGFSHHYISQSFCVTIYALVTYLESNIKDYGLPKGRTD